MAIRHLCPRGHLITKPGGYCRQCPPKGGGTTARGYGAQHQRLRKAWANTIAGSCHVLCSRCGQEIKSTDAWDLDHTNDRTGYLGPSHTVCNRDNTRFLTSKPNDPVPGFREKNVRGQESGVGRG